MSQVNLLPPEIRQRQAVRRTTSLIVATGLGVLALIGVFYFLQMQRLSGAQADLEAQEAENAQLQSQIAELQPFANLEAELKAKQDLVDTLFANEISWSAALLDVSRVIPDASYLTNLSGTLTTVATPTDPTLPPEGVVSALIGSITFQGVAEQTETIATWLTRLEQVDGWVNAWVSSAQENGPRTNVYTFSSGLDLTIDAATERGRGLATP